MDVKFIGQGLSSPSDRPAGDVINEILERAEFREFSAFVAFASAGGIKQILPNLKRFMERKGKVRLFVGVNLHATSKEALELLMAEQIPSYIVFSPNKVVYHPKVYTFEGATQYFIIVGSSNLTTSGLYQSVEASLCVENNYDANDDEGKSLLSDIYDYYNGFLNGESTSCNKLTQDILDVLVDAKIVLPEKKTREFSNVYEKELKVQLSDIEKLENTFGKLKRRKPKSSPGKKTVRTEIIEPGEKDIMIHSTSIEIPGNSMWIETGRMTGGSRNILDLSAKGKRDGVEKPGSVEFFGIDKKIHSAKKDISLVYNNKVYTSNTILYGVGNNNWGLQLKGVARDKSKMTDISCPKLGTCGGFQFKILVFEKTRKTNKYKLHILDQSELDNLIAQSSDWTRGGSGKGRAYGFIP